MTGGKGCLAVVISVLECVVAAAIAETSAVAVPTAAPTGDAAAEAGVSQPMLQFLNQRVLSQQQWHTPRRHQGSGSRRNCGFFPTSNSDTSCCYRYGGSNVYGGTKGCWSTNRWGNHDIGGSTRYHGPTAGSCVLQPILYYVGMWAGLVGKLPTSTKLSAANLPVPPLWPPTCPLAHRRLRAFEGFLAGGVSKSVTDCARRWTWRLKLAAYCGFLRHVCAE